MILMPVATMSHIVEFVTAFIGLSAVFAVFLDGDPQIVFRLVDIAVTSILCPRGQGRTDQADQSQQGYAKNSDCTSHFASPLGFCE
jgi:hypothetical protein